MITTSHRGFRMFATCPAGEGMGFEAPDPFCPQLNFQFVKDQLDEKQILCFETETK